MELSPFFGQSQFLRTAVPVNSTGTPLTTFHLQYRYPAHDFPSTGTGTPLTTFHLQYRYPAHDFPSTGTRYTSIHLFIFDVIFPKPRDQGSAIVCCAICLCNSPDLDGCRAPKRNGVLVLLGTGVITGSPDLDGYRVHCPVPVPVQGTKKGWYFRDVHPKKKRETVEGAVPVYTSALYTVHSTGIQYRYFGFITMRLYQLDLIVLTVFTLLSPVSGSIYSFGSSKETHGRWAYRYPSPSSPLPLLLSSPLLEKSPPRYGGRAASRRRPSPTVE